MPDLTAAVLILGACSIFLAAFLGGVVGFAYGLVALPLLLLLGVPLSEVIAINLVTGLVTRLAVVARRRRDVDKRRTALLVGGSLPGLSIGLLVHGLVSVRLIQIGAGFLTIAAAVALALGLPRRPARTGGAHTAFAAGGLGGFLGATTSLNGIPPALLLTNDRATARTLVADLAVYFVIGNTLTLSGMLVTGYTPSTATWAVLGAWVPAGVIGNLIGISLGPRLPQHLFRRLTLVVILVSGIWSTVQALR